MKYSINKNETYAIITLGEENLNSTKAPDLKSEFIILKNEGIGNLILNLEAVKYIDSSGLSAILTGNRLWSEGGTFVLTGVVHPNVQSLITVSQLQKVLNIIPTDAEAVDYVMMNELERELGAEE